MVSKTKLMVLTILILGSSYATSMAGLEVKIAPLKSTYLLREPVLIHYQVKNVGPDSAWFWQSDIPLNFIVKDSKNKRYYCNYEVTHLAPPPTFKPPAFKLGESVEGIANLNDYYGRVALPINKYRVYLEVEYGKDKISKSNTIEIEIIEPSGKEKEVFSELLAVDSLMRLKNSEEAYKKLASIYRNYPTSVYAHYCVSQSLSILYLSDVADKSKLAHLGREFIDKYPNSRYIETPLWILIEYYQSKKDKIGYSEELKSLIQKYPGTEVERKAKVRLENLDKVKF